MRSEYFLKAGIKLVPTTTNLVDEVWAAEKPSLPKEKVWILDDKYTGEPIQEKLKNVASKLTEGANMMLVTALDDIAWLLNLRGNDIDFNPVFFSYVILHKDEAGDVKLDLFIDADKVS